MNNKFLLSFLLAVALLSSTTLFANETTSTDESLQNTELTESVQTEVEQESKAKANKKREKIIKEAVAAVSETRNALKALEEGNTDSALKSLEVATGKLELVLARDPGLALAPIDVDVITHDLISNIDSVERMIKEAQSHLDDGNIQQARPLLKYLASEIIFRTTSIPLATYPAAIKEITPLIDEGDIDAAKQGLKIALATLVTVDEVIPLPLVRAERFLANAEELAEMEERTEKDTELLTALIDDARKQLQLAEVLGYATGEKIKPMYKQLDEIEEKSIAGKEGHGWFDKIKRQLKELV